MRKEVEKQQQGRSWAEMHGNSGRLEEELSVEWVGRFSYPLCHLTSCSSKSLKGRGDPGLQSWIPEPPVPLPVSHCPGDTSVEVCRPDAQV